MYEHLLGAVAGRLSGLCACLRSSSYISEGSNGNLCLQQDANRSMLLFKAIAWTQVQEVLEGGDIGLTGRQVDVRDVAAAHVRAAEVHHWAP